MLQVDARTLLVVVDAAQITQSESVSWLPAAVPTSAMYRPMGHDVHVDEPVFEAYEPAGHTWQYDSWSWQEAAVAASARYLPTAHDMHLKALANST